MQFVVVYPNNPEAKAAIFGRLVEWSKKVDLEKREITANHFKVVKDWPPKEVLHTFPLGLQIEEVKIENDQIISLRKLVVDVEAGIEQEKIETVPETPTITNEKSV